MTWEWEYQPQGGHWVVTVGVWQAVVQRVGAARAVWQATLARTSAPHERLTSPTYPDAVDARAWALRTIAELARQTTGSIALATDRYDIGTPKRPQHIAGAATVESLGQDAPARVADSGRISNQRAWRSRDGRRWCSDAGLIEDVVDGSGEAGGPARTRSYRCI